jgi:hypothetical protein
MSNKITVDVYVNVKAKHSFWDAIKLRLAGAHAVKEFLDIQFAKIAEEEKEKEC